MQYFKPLIIVSAGIVIFSCGKSYLDKRPLGQLDETALANKRGVERLLIGAYSMLDGIGGNKSDWYSAASNWIYGSICGSEAYKGSNAGDQGTEISPVELFTHTANNTAIASKWGTVYDGVSRANDVLRVMKKAKDISPVDQERIAAEARFLRAHYHFEAKKMWNKIPFVDETITYGDGNYHVSNEKDAWSDIENDLKFAIDNLEVDPYTSAVGRASKYTATALLAKAYMFQKKFVLAKPLLDAIITSGKYSLVNYADNFNPATRNSRESIFSVQMSVNDGSGGMNGNYGDILNFPMGGPGGCCGFFQPSQYLVNHYKTDPITGLPDLDNFNDVSVTNDDGIESADPSFTPYAGTLDPRLDWTVGRRGIPYLDWGLHPGKDWINDQDYGGPYSPKKNVYYKSQQGQLQQSTGWGADGQTTNNVNLIRYADVLLWAAEVEIETGGNLVKARDYINQVRSRAGDTNGWVKNSSGSFPPYAANYKIDLYAANLWNQDYARKALRYERMLELAMEGHRFFDLVRWGIADIEIAAYKLKEKNRRTYLNEITFKKGCSEYFAIPQLQIDLSAGADGIKKMGQSGPCY